MSSCAGKALHITSDSIRDNLIFIKNDAEALLRPRVLDTGSVAGVALQIEKSVRNSPLIFFSSQVLTTTHYTNTKILILLKLPETICHSFQFVVGGGGRDARVLLLRTEN